MKQGLNSVAAAADRLMLSAQQIAGAPARVSPKI
jgi:hypothetical protein